MPNPSAQSGTFSDLYDAMQQRQPARHPTASPPPAIMPKPENLAIPTSVRGREGRREEVKPPSLPGDSKSPPVFEPFDVNERPYRKGSFMLTNEEFWSLDEIKIDLQKRFDVTATKDDLARCAFRQMLADYKQNGEFSFLLAALRKKTRR